MLMHEQDERLDLLPVCLLRGGCEGLRISNLPLPLYPVDVGTTGRAGDALVLEPACVTRTLQVDWPLATPLAVTVDGRSRADYSADGIRLEGVSGARGQW